MEKWNYGHALLEKFEGAACESGVRPGPTALHPKPNSIWACPGSARNEALMRDSRTAPVHGWQWHHQHGKALIGIALVGVDAGIVLPWRISWIGVNIRAAARSQAQGKRQASRIKQAWSRMVQACSWFRMGSCCWQAASS